MEPSPARRDELARAAKSLEAFHSCPMRLRRPLREHVGGELLPRERGRNDGNRLREIGYFTFEIGCEEFPIFNREEWLATRPIKEENVPRLCRLRHSINPVAVAHDRDEARRCGEIAIPNVMSHGLEVPHAFASLCVQCDKRIGEQVIAKAIRAVEIVCRRTSGNKQPVLYLHPATFLTSY